MKLTEDKLSSFIGSLNADLYMLKQASEKKSRDYFLSSIGSTSDMISELVQYVLKFGEE